MRLATFLHQGKQAIGIVKDAGIINLTTRIDTADICVVLERPELAAAHASAQPDLALDAVTLLPPVVAPQKIMCIGLNYMTHAREANMEVPNHPTIFVRFPNSVVGSGQPMIRPKASERYDFEAELAVVICKRCRHVPENEAYSVIGGYSCFNDGSVRDWQRHTTQFTPGKNFYHSGSFGPWITTTDELPGVGNERIMTRLNGETMQDGNINDLIFSIPQLIAYCSTFTELLPGDVIATGTTSGVGTHRKPPIFLKPGDLVEVEVPGIGVLSNSIVDEA
jgi:2-keto-4-pentenoate hydratase/2-oxohepta-3-ene-1,7-dioic acid hydratase in catechol pathway